MKKLKYLIKEDLAQVVITAAGLLFYLLITVVNIIQVIFLVMDLFPRRVSMEILYSGRFQEHERSQAGEIEKPSRRSWCTYKIFERWKIK